MKNSLNSLLSTFVPDYKIYADNHFSVIDYDRNLKNEIEKNGNKVESTTGTKLTTLFNNIPNVKEQPNFEFASELLKYIHSPNGKSAIVVLNGTILKKYPALYIFILTVDKAANLNIINIYNPLLLAEKVRGLFNSSLVNNIYKCISDSVFTDKNVNLAKNSLKDLFLLFNENIEPVSSSRKWFSELLYLFHEPKKVNSNVDFETFYKDTMKEDGIKSKYKELLALFPDRKSVDSLYSIKNCIPFNRCSKNKLFLID